MENEKLLSNAAYNKKKQQENPGTLEDVLNELKGIDMMFQSFLETEGAGMVICENCLDNVYDDDEDIRTWMEDNGQLHIFCCEDCLKEWKKGH